MNLFVFIQHNLNRVTKLVDFEVLPTFPLYFNLRILMMAEPVFRADQAKNNRMKTKVAEISSRSYTPRSKQTRPY